MEKILIIIGLTGILMIVWIRLFLLKKSIKEISDGLNEKLSEDTNVPLTLTSGDTIIRKLVSDLNRELSKLREEKLQVQNNRLSLQNSVTNIAHDIRTPLAAISGYLDLLGNEEMSDRAEGYVEVVRERTETLTNLTEEFFRYSVMVASEEELQLTDVSLNQALEIAISGEYAMLSRKGIEPEIHFPGKDIHRQLDEKVLQRIFGNILSNVVRYSDGDLIIELTEEGEIIFTNHAEKLDEVTVGRLFERYYTVENANGSTGLGLSIARYYTKKLNGQIKAYYDHGELKISLIFTAISH